MKTARKIMKVLNLKIQKFIPSKLKMANLLNPGRTQQIFS